MQLPLKYCPSDSSVSVPNPSWFRSVMRKGIPPFILLDYSKLSPVDRLCVTGIMVTKHGIFSNLEASNSMSL